MSCYLLLFYGSQKPLKSLPLRFKDILTRNFKKGWAADSIYISINNIVLIKAK